MSQTANAAEEITVEVLGLRVNVLKAGSGPPLLVVHRDTGRVWNELHEDLAREFTVYAPSLPGWEGSDRPEWMRNVRELANVGNLLLDRLGLERAAALGLGFGGWVAGQAALESPHRYSHLVLHAPMGVQPPEGEIVDQFLFFARDYVKQGFVDPATFVSRLGEPPSSEQEMSWDIAREMSTRIAWKPYMFDQGLPNLLPGVRVPTLVLLSAEDRIVPRSAVERWAAQIPGARLIELDRAGHQLDLEDPRRLAATVIANLAAEPAARR